jgi:hypothetical protein
MPGMVKIGKTDRHPNDRARELTTTGTPHPFVAAYWRIVPDPATAEIQLHRLFDQYRANQKREFFEVDVVKVIDAMQELETAGNATRHLVGGYLPDAVEPYLYWVQLQDSNTFVRIGISDLPRPNLQALIATTLSHAFPTMDLRIGAPRFFELRNREMGNEVLSQLREREVKSMPGVFSAVSFDELARIHGAHEGRMAKIIADRHDEEIRALYSSIITELSRRI